MTIGVVIPLKAKAVSKNWDIVEENLFQTLLSLKNQSSPLFHAVVVGHDCPSFLLEGAFEGHANISFLHFDELAPPIISSDEASNQIKFENDRCSKIYKGYRYLTGIGIGIGISHLFPLDADDLVSNDFVQYVIEHGKGRSLLIENGYVLYKNKDIINEINNFSTFCGSSFVARVELLSGTDEVSIAEEFLFKRIGHVAMRDYLESNSINFHIPDQRLVLYVRDNGENISRHGKMKLLLRLKRTIKLLAAAKLFKASIKKKFSIINS